MTISHAHCSVNIGSVLRHGSLIMILNCNLLFSCFIQRFCVHVSHVFFFALWWLVGAGG